ncbi:MAG: Protein-L-isoaspartate O-methyltransferase [Chroococcopsis gigantea SAG 12.99]|jgi:predicted methyltransferase|nr:class I SAM-dependent methyltransferase [Chlorogloea purpurea SAG 13.99]MDV2998523.1 Protein-L-isoaspartate O-methyltransferase [Chroococcopsis gigantea SAG 12.99]
MNKNYWKRKISRLLIGTVLSGFILIFGLSLSLRAAVRGEESVPVTSKISLVHLASNDSFDITENGVKAAKLMLDAIDNNNTDSALKASQLYTEIIFKENFGGDYTALQWMAVYMSGNSEQQQKMLKDKYAASYYDFFAANNFANLREYIERKYKLKEFSDRYTAQGRDREAFLEDFIRFNNPRREEWEKTSKVLEAIDIKPGEKIIDVGSGPGYYTFKFSELVGDKGKVYAVDTVQNHLDYVARVSDKYGIKNVEPVKTDGVLLGVTGEGADRAFMCSLYHIIYTVSREGVQEKYINSIKQALKPGGQFIIVDNAPVDEGKTLPYQGPHIAKELIIGQLKYYGFELEKEYAFIPQRYILVFKKA